MNSSLAFCKYSDPSVIEPVIVGALPPDITIKQKISQRFHDKGFTVVRFAGIEPNPQNMDRLARAITLGTPYDQRRDTNFGSVQYSPEGFNLVGGKIPTVSNGDLHPAFSTTRKQEVHSDATRHPIGFVKTTTLLCVCPGQSGGESTVFNAVAAFARLHHETPALAVALMDERAMIRTSDIDPEKKYSGPAFKIAGGELLSRFSIDRPIAWATAAVPHLDKALDRMKEMAQPGSAYYVKFPLAAGDMLLIANDRISHGREAYTNGEPPREMWRGLYTTRPAAGAGLGSAH